MVTYTYICKKCGNVMSVPDRYLDRGLKCTKCSEPFTVALSEDGSGDTKKCPFCAEEIKAAAIVCKHCGRDLEQGAQKNLAPAKTEAKVPDQLGIALMMPWFAGAALVYFWVWQSPILLAPSRLGMVALITLGAAAGLTALDASIVLKATGKRVNEWSVASWFFGTLLVAIIVAPYYAFKRGKYQGFSSRYTALVVAGILVFAGVCGLTGVMLDNAQASVAEATSGRMVLPQSAATPPPIVTRTEYERIKEGMTYDQVKAIIGAPGEELSRSNMAGYMTVMYSWTNANGSNMNAMFQNGALINKAQFGLP